MQFNFHKKYFILGYPELQQNTKWCTFESLRWFGWAEKSELNPSFILYDSDSQNRSFKMSKIFCFNVLLIQRPQMITIWRIIFFSRRKYNVSNYLFSVLWLHFLQMRILIDYDNQQSKALPIIRGWSISFAEQWHNI